MTNPNPTTDSSERSANDPFDAEVPSGAIDFLALASTAISALSFLTLLRLADRQNRTPARALGLFFATTAESIGGTVLGLIAMKRAPDQRSRGDLLLAGAGVALGMITTVLNFNWMRTRRRV